MSTVPEKWLERARYDLETAQAMRDSGRWLYVLFCCQQAIEKALKAVIAQRTKEFPPRLHNLVSLAEFAKIAVPEEKEGLFRILTDFYIGSRYPDEVREVGKDLGKANAERYLAETSEAFEWLRSML